MSVDYPEVVGICPACGWHSLSLGAGGFVTCSRGECPDPEAATHLLEGMPVRVVMAAPPLDREQLLAAALSEPRQQIMTLPPTVPPGLSLDQLHEVAEHLRRRYPPPSSAMRPDLYLVSEGMHALAVALDEVAGG